MLYLNRGQNILVEKILDYTTKFKLQKFPNNNLYIYFKIVKIFLNSFTERF